MLVCFLTSLNKWFILESVNDHVIISRYPFDAIERWKKWNNFCCLFSVAFFLIFRGSSILIWSYPFILTISSTISIGWLISGLQDGTIKFIIFFCFFILKPKSVNILIIFFSVTLNPVVFSNKESSNFIEFFLNFHYFEYQNY